VNIRIEEEREFKAIGTDTEIELVLPIIEEVRLSLDRLSIEEFCRKYPIFTTDISFKFGIIDNSNPPPLQTALNDLDCGTGIPSSYNDHEKDTILARGLLETITKGPPKAKIRFQHYIGLP
jgi:hypothetical protein